MSEGSENNSGVAAERPVQRLGAAIIQCSDFERSLEFYTGKLGLLAIDKDGQRGRALLQLGGGHVVLQRVDRDEQPQPSLGGITNVVFETADLQEARRLLEARGIYVQGVGGDSSTRAELRDPDGNVLTIRQYSGRDRGPERDAFYAKVHEGGRGSVGGPEQVWALHPCLRPLIDASGGYLLLEGKLPARLRELAIITTARVFTAQIEWYAHVPRARRAGITPDVVEAIANRRAPAFERSDEALVHRVALEIHETRTLGDDTYRALVGELGVECAVELIGLLGFYGTVAMALNTFNIHPPAEATRLLPP